MKPAQPVRILLEKPLLDSARAGQHNFIGLMARALAQGGYSAEFCENTAVNRVQAVADDCLTVSHMQEPPTPDGLVFRRVYQYPFWRIERSAKRWHWDVAKDTFDPLRIDAGPADQFYRFWRKRLFGTAAQNSTRQGYVYIPLQGKLMIRRSFQKCSPLDMIAHCLAQTPHRRVVAALHPNEVYSHDERQHLNDIAARDDRLQIDTGNMAHHLQACDYVVTQNSSAAFSGFFFGKPALLFAKIDFHHIALNAEMSALDRSFAKIADHRPPFARYIWWFWQKNSINAGRDDAEERICARFRQLGWFK